MVENQASAISQKSGSNYRFERCYLPAAFTASVGISVYPIHSDSEESLVKQADTAMYQAKQLGKNRYEVA